MRELTQAMETVAALLIQERARRSRHPLCEWCQEAFAEKFDGCLICSSCLVKRGFDPNKFDKLDEVPAGLKAQLRWAQGVLKNRLW